MSAYELELIIRKRHQLRRLLVARARVKQLEREVRGELVKPDAPPFVPRFLRMLHANRLSHLSGSAAPSLRDERAALVTTAMNSWGRRSARGLPAPRRLHLIEGHGAPNRAPIELQREPSL
jgi:hypothetical protein